MRVSAGFLVTGLWGKMLIQTFPPRLIFLVIAIRAASIWRLVIQDASNACSPYSPNWTSVPPLAWPRIRPRWGFLYFSFFGTSIAYRFRPAHLDTAQPAATLYPGALSSAAHGARQGPLHRPPERRPTLKL